MHLKKFSSATCQPCKQVSLMLSEYLDNRHVNDIEEFTLEANLDKFQKYNVRLVPTLLFVDDEGNEIKRHMGATTKAKLDQFLNV